MIASTSGSRRSGPSCRRYVLVGVHAGRSILTMFLGQMQHETERRSWLASISMEVPVARTPRTMDRPGASEVVCSTFNAVLFPRGTANLARPRFRRGRRPSAIGLRESKAVRARGHAVRRPRT